MAKKGPTKKELVEIELERRVGILAPIFAVKIPDKDTVRQLAIELIRGAEDGLEFANSSFDEWIETRFKRQLIWLTTEDYERALLRALWLARPFSASGFCFLKPTKNAQVLNY